MATWIVGAAVTGIIALALWKLIHDRRRGKSCGSCVGCDKCKRAD